MVLRVVQNMQLAFKFLQNIERMGLLMMELKKYRSILNILQNVEGKYVVLRVVQSMQRAFKFLQNVE
jgi:hypothetical protein